MAADGFDSQQASDQGIQIVAVLLKIDPYPGGGSIVKLREKVSQRSQLGI